MNRHHRVRLRTLIGLFAPLTAVAFGLAQPATQTRPHPATRPAIVLEAEAAELHGTLSATTRPGYSGDGYATAFDAEDDRIVFRAYSDAGGIFNADIRYSAPFVKGFGLTVNGLGHEDFFPPSGDAFATHMAGIIELRPGENIIELRKGWGAYDVDRIELIPTRLAPVRKPPATLVDRNASPAARDLMQRLIDGYGRGTLSAVQGHADAENVFRRTGVWPAILGQDLMEYSPSRVAHGSKPAGTTERLIKDAAAGYTAYLTSTECTASALISCISCHGSASSDRRR